MIPHEDPGYAIREYDAIRARRAKHSAELRKRAAELYAASEALTKQAAEAETAILPAIDPTPVKGGQGHEDDDLTSPGLIAIALFLGVCGLAIIGAVIGYLCAR